MASGKLPNDDTDLISAIKIGIIEFATMFKDNDNPKASQKAGAKKAQMLVADVTAAYTQAIFHSKSAPQAHKILSRFQDTIQMIVDFTKQGKFAP